MYFCQDLPTHPMKNITIPATDAYPLAASLFEPVSTPIPTVVCINSAGGVKRDFYKKFASFLTEAGFLCLTWDVRGIGGSRPVRMRGFEASFEDWAAKDYQGVLQWLRHQYPKRPIAVVGHSIGGAYPGMILDHEGIVGLLTVGTQGAYYKDWHPAIKRKLYFQWHIMMPLLTKLVGYFPGRRLGMLEDIPAGVVRDWHARRKYPTIQEHHAAEGKPSGYHLLKMKMRVIGIADDPIGTPQSIKRFLTMFDNPQLEYLHIAPKDIGADKIGHFDFFRSRFKDSLWQDCLQWLKSL